MRRFILFLFILSAMALSTTAQDNQVSWSRAETTASGEPDLFRSGHAANLETAAALSRGNLEFQIYHRFFPAMSEGYDNFYGFDGPVNMRIGLAYGVSDNMVVSLGRSNVDDNLDLNAKYKLFTVTAGNIPVQAALVGGMAWNTGVFGRDDTDGKNFQYYGQAVVNAVVFKKLGIGVVPSYLYNSDINADDYETTFGMGGYLQYYLTNRFSLMAEMTGVIDGVRRPYDNYVIGMELQTAGHFFKIIMTNGMYLNPGQYIMGADYPFKSKEWRLGFMITRVLAL